MAKKESEEYTLYGDLDGMTVGELETLLERYPDDARIVVKTEPGVWSGTEYQYFVFKWEE